MKPYDNAWDRKNNKKTPKGSEIKSILLDHKKWNQLFALVPSGAMSEGLKKNVQCPTIAICHKQERHTHQLSNIRHQNIVCKSYYWTRSNIMLDGLHSCPWQSGWVHILGEGRECGCQADSPQVSPSNELWTSCFGWAGQQPSPPLKPAWHFHTGQGAGGP